MSKETDRDHALRQHATNRAVADQLMAAANENANIALKALLTVNGGAVVVLLAFAGSAGISTADPDPWISGFVEPLTFFAWGVASAVGATMFAYMVNYAYSSTASSRVLTWDHPYTQETKASRRWQRFGTTLHWMALAASAASLGLFTLGVASIADALIPD